MDEYRLQLQEVTGFSTITLADAIRNALVRVAQTLPPIQVQWVQIGETREISDHGQVVGWHVTLLLGVRVENAPHQRTRGSAGLREEEKATKSSESPVDSPCCLC
jgi:flavin-binding protein dodecin